MDIGRWRGRVCPAGTRHPRIYDIWDHYVWSSSQIPSNTIKYPSAAKHCHGNSWKSTNSRISSLLKIEHDGFFIAGRDTWGYHIQKSSIQRSWTSFTEIQSSWTQSLWRWTFHLSAAQQKTDVMGQLVAFLSSGRLKREAPDFCHSPGKFHEITRLWGL